MHKPNIPWPAFFIAGFLIAIVANAFYKYYPPPLPPQPAEQVVIETIEDNNYISFDYQGMHYVIEFTACQAVLPPSQHAVLAS